MRKFLVFYFIVQVLVCLIMPSLARADTTYVSGIIDTNTTWTPAGSPYIVTGHVVVDSSATLNIQPGVEVRIDPDKHIMIFGTMNAFGTEVDSILITKNGSARWDRLWFKSALAGSLKYCRIEYAARSAIYNEGTPSLYIGYNTISNNSTSENGGGIYRGITITNNTISNNHATQCGGGIYDGSLITRNTFSYNGAGGSYYGDGNDIYIDYGPSSIIGNVFSISGIYNSDIYIRHGSPEVKIRYNTINSIRDAAIYVHFGSGTGISALIRTNNFYTTGYAVYNYTPRDIDARYNYWGTISPGEIEEEKIYDHYDEWNHGEVFYRPYLTAPFTDTIPPDAPINLTANGDNPSPWTNNPEFVIDWTNPFDSSGISEIYYKLGPVVYPPESDFDKTGSFHYPPDTITATQYGQMLYVWLVDSEGNLAYGNYSSVNLRYESSPPSAPTNLLANSSSPSPWTNDSLFIITWSNPYDTSGISKALYKLGSAPTSNYDTTGLLSGIPADTVFSSIEGSIPFYLWLVDGAGNVDYNNTSVADLRYDTIPPTIDSTTQLQDTVDFWGPFTVDTKISDNFDIKDAILYFRINSSDWIADTMVSTGDYWYMGEIHGQTPADTLTLDYYITASDSADNISRDPEEGNYSFKIFLTGIQEIQNIPDRFILFSPNPNPSIGRVEIQYGLPEKTNVSLQVYDIQGRLVKPIFSGSKNAGYYKLHINSQDLSSGIYFLRFEAEGYNATRKLLIIR